MIKLAYILNSLALLFCLIGAWKIFSIQAEIEYSHGKLAELKLKVSDLTLALDEAKKGQDDRLAREKRKNLELEDQANAFVDEVSDLTRKRDEINQVIASAQKESDELSADIQMHKVSLGSADARVEAARVENRAITLNIPTLQSKITDLENKILGEKQRKEDLEYEIATYDKETGILKDHYDKTISALQKDFYERPWLDRGERVSVEFSKLDLTSGLLMLPIGKDHGIEQKMRFAVRAEGQSICQVEIKKVGFDHCVAMIIPLLGNPSKLEEFSKLDLIYL
jgi:predicted  nucleic acid-binding Zn-ribbon protein